MPLRFCDSDILSLVPVISLSLLHPARITKTSRKHNTATGAATPRHRTSKASAENGLLPYYAVGPSRFRLHTNTSPRQGTDTEHTARHRMRILLLLSWRTVCPCRRRNRTRPTTLRSHNPAFWPSAGTSWLLHAAPVQRVFGQEEDAAACEGQAGSTPDTVP